MADHAARGHAQWSASATDRNWNCAGALALTDGLPETVSEAADWGTCAHQIAEHCIRDDSDAVAFIGTTQTGKTHSFTVDEEMADTAQTYVDYVRERRAAYKKETGDNAIIFIEEQFSLDELNPPFEAGGTSDCVLIFPKWHLLEVVDLKGGRGVVVEVKGNPQALTYALGALIKHPSKVDTVKSTIVQPRAPHKDGRTRSDTIAVADLVDWTIELGMAMQMAREAIDRHPRNGSDMSLAEWNAKFLKAGDHCQFCKAAGFCPALRQRALDAAKVWFDDLDQPRISNAPDDMSPEQLAATLGLLDMIGEWMNSVRAYAHEQAEAGVEIPGFQLVEKIGNRAWLEADSIVAQKLKKMGVVDPWTHKIASPAQAEKLLGAKRKGEIAPMVERPIKGTNLVAISSSTRPATLPAAHRHFDILD